MLATGRAAACILLVTILIAFTGCGGAESRYTAHMSRGQAYFASGDYARASVEFRNALQVVPKDAGARLMAGRAAEKLGKPRDALGLYQSVVDDTPDNLEARANLGRLMIFGGVPERGLKVIEPALDKHPDEVRLLALRAAARVQLKDTAGAVADLERALTLAPANEEAVALRARLYQDAGDFPRAIALVSGALRRTPNSNDLHQVLANLYIAAGEPDKAEAELRFLISLNPEKLPYRNQLALYYAGSNRIDDAQRVLEDAVKALPQNDAPKLTLVDFVAARRSAAEAENLLRGYVAAQPNDHDLRLALGSLLASSGAATEATEAFSEVIRRDGVGPSGLIARDRLATLAVSQGRNADARKYLEQVLEKNPRDSAALILRAQIALSQGDPMAAIADLRALAQDMPHAVGVQKMLAHAYEAAGDATLAEQTFRTAMDLAPADTSLRVDLAELLVGTGRAGAAVPLLEETVRKAPSDVPAREGLVRAYLAAADLAAARTAAQDLETLRPDAASSAYLVALVAERQGRIDDARREYQHALVLQPKAFAPLEALAGLENRSGHAAQAIALVKDAAARDPKDAVLVNLLGGLYLAQKNYPLATDTLTQAAALAPNWYAPYRNLALTRLAAQDLPGTIAAYQAAIKAAPAEPKLVTELAQIYTSRGRVDDAVALYDAAHRRNPDSAVIARNLAILLVTYRSDHASLDRARDLTRGFASSSDGSLLDTNGWVHVKRGEYHDALPVLQRAVERAPDSLEIRYHLGMAELRAGESARARHDLEKATSTPAKFSWSEDARLALATLTTPTG